MEQTTISTQDSGAASRDDDDDDDNHDSNKYILVKCWNENRKKGEITMRTKKIKHNANTLE